MRYKEGGNLVVLVDSEFRAESGGIGFGREFVSVVGKGTRIFLHSEGLLMHIICWSLCYFFNYLTFY